MGKVPPPAPAAPATPAAPEEPKQPQSVSASQSFGAAFFGKLREQSFTIMVMVAIVAYQHLMWEKDREEYKKVVAEHQAKYELLVNEERKRLLEREMYLRQHRDQFIELLKDQAAWGRVEKRAVGSK